MKIQGLQKKVAQNNATITTTLRPKDDTTTIEFSSPSILGALYHSLEQLQEEFFIFYGTDTPLPA
jgi:hypothetical protein